MLIAIFNNLSELVLGLTWTGLVVYLSMKLGAWRERRRINKL